LTGPERDELDNRVLECAVERKVNYIVSGDKHLLGLRKYKGIGTLNAGRILNKSKLNLINY